MICFMSKSYTVDKDMEQDGSIWRKNIGPVNFPATFISVPIVNTTVSTNVITRQLTSSISAITTTAINYIYVLCHWNASEAGGVVNIQVIGKWK